MREIALSYFVVHNMYTQVIMYIRTTRELTSHSITICSVSSIRRPSAISFTFASINIKHRTVDGNNCVRTIPTALVYFVLQ